MNTNLAQRAESLRLRISALQLTPVSEHVLQQAVSAFRHVQNGQAPSDIQKLSLREAAQAVGLNYHEIRDYCAADKETKDLVMQEMGMNSVQNKFPRIIDQSRRELLQAMVLRGQ